MTVLAGQCHCGAVQATYRTDVDLDAIEVRACQCSFCRRHRSWTIGDAQGQLTLSFDPAAVHRYRFGAGETDFLICGACGAYVAAVMEVDGATHGVLNVVAADIAALTGRTPKPMNYDAETPADKRARRTTRWAPTTIHLSGKAA
jgi:hypothetical protein